MRAPPAARAMLPVLMVALAGCGYVTEQDYQDRLDWDDDGFIAQQFEGLDCDDRDATVFPGAPDEWYDGVDSDCEGDDDYDQDGDGYASDQHGGDDCDDLDPDINPGADEKTLDATDWDCDGNPAL